MFLLLLSLLGLSLQFNLDTQSVQIIKSDNGMFGYTVALQKTGADEKLILVGSPNAETGVPGVLEGGAVFKCNIPRLDEVSSTPVECADTIEAFNDGGNAYYDDFGFKEPVESDIYNILAENKSRQFLGVSMAATDNYVAVCGHRYEHRFWLKSYKEDLPRQLIGRCLVAYSETSDLRNFKPCDINEDAGYMTYGYCQAGMSVALREDTIVLGAPGTDRALGRAYKYDLLNPVDESIDMDKIPTPQNQPTTDKYMGYSSVICNMDGDIDYTNGYEMVFGGPRGEMYSGEVRIYSSMFEGNPASSLSPFLNELNASWIYNFPGEQMGSYFGHSLACADVNGDGFEDIIVGAPWYTHYTPFDIFADTGRIYIMYGSFYLDDLTALQNPQKITGDQANAAFGYSLANGGDMNDDTFIDVFVGAPYYDDGEGAVFLYLGSEDGLQSDYSQIIKPSTLNVLDNILTFGWSISPGRDMDGNGYPDIAIGAYKSGHVAFIRSKSIIDVVPNLTFKLTSFNDTHKVTSLQVCLRYDERPGRDPLEIDEVPIKFSITVDPEHFRLSFSDNELVRTWVPPTMNVSTLPGSPFCTSNQDIFYDNSTGNVQPMPVIMAAEIDDPKLTSLVLNQEIIKSKKAELKIQSECHPDTGICKADLTVELDPEVEFPESNLYPSVVFGYVQSFTQKITVSNIGTDPYNYVYNAAVNITFPSDIMIFSTVSIDGANVNCKMMDTYLLCKLSDDGPINKDDKIHTFGIEFDITEITEPIKLHIAVEVIVDEPTIDEGDDNNVADKFVEVKELADLLINGGAGRSKVAFNNQYTIVNRAIGSPELDIKHEYSVELSEDAEQPLVRGVGVSIYWPQQVPMTDIHIVPLYNISMRTPVGVDVYCVPSLNELYPEAVGNKDSLQVTDEFELPVTDRDDDFSIPNSLNCADTKEACQLISCEIDEIKRGSAFSHGFKISLFAKVHEANLYNSPGVNVTSFAMISHVADSTNMTELPLKRSAYARTELYPSVRKSQNWIWVIIGAVIGGLIFLFLLILCLWKCGFFKRKQPPTIKADKVDEQIDMTVYGQ